MMMDIEGVLEYFPEIDLSIRNILQICAKVADDVSVLNREEYEGLENKSIGTLYVVIERRVNGKVDIFGIYQGDKKLYDCGDSGVVFEAKKLVRYCPQGTDGYLTADGKIYCCREDMD